MNRKTHWARSALLLSLCVLTALAIVAIAAPTAEAQALKQHCNARCTANRTICLDSTLPDIVPGGNAVAGCNSRCLESQQACEAKCTGRNAAQCRQACNQTLAGCATACSNRVQGCNDAFVSCRNRCEAIPQCLRDSDCGGGPCVNGICEAPCTSNQQCQQRMGEDGRCIVPPNKRLGRCALI